jgi:transcriptional regulator GlxA family with amidase domain
MATWSGKPAVDYLGADARRVIDAEPRLTRLFRVDLAKGPRTAPHVREAARSVAMDVRTFERWMKRWARTTWKEFVDSWRVEEAKRLLSFPGSRVKDVAEAVGYRRSDEMARAFRRRRLPPPHTFIARGASSPTDVAP